MRLSYLTVTDNEPAAKNMNVEAFGAVDRAMWRMSFRVSESSAKVSSRKACKSQLIVLKIDHLRS